MKNLYLCLLAIMVTGFMACENNDEEPMMTTSYEITIDNPTTDDKKVGDMLDIKVVASEANDGTVHHMKVRIYNKADNQEIYNQPDDAHVHSMTGSYTFEDQIMLDVDGHTDWILEAKVWGHEAGAAEVVKTVEFHVHPN